MIDDAELEKMHTRLRHMEPDRPCSLGGYIYRADQIIWIIEEAQQAREWAKVSLENTRP